MCDALGIVNFESYRIELDEMTQFRPLSAISILGRYRIVDFVLSNMSNSGINQLQVYIKEKPRSLIEHIGTGRHYNINSKKGSIRILHGERTELNGMYNTDVQHFYQNMEFIEEAHNEYVVVAPSYMIYTCDYSKVLEEHISTNADVTILYKAVTDAKEKYWGSDFITMDRFHRVISIEHNNTKANNRNISLECYVMKRSLFIELVQKAMKTSSIYWFRDILADSVDSLVINGVAHKGYVGCVNYLGGYYRTSMELKQPELAKEMFKEDWPIYTKTNDSAPTYFSEEAEIRGAMIANGCVIEGTVINSIVGRNVKVGKGAVIKNSIVLPNVTIGEDVHLDTVVVDKHASVNKVKTLVGEDTNSPLYIKRRDLI